MGKRMTEPEKWRDPWFRSLTPEEKLVFLFLIDQCNWGGFYELDIPYMSFCIGIPESSCQGALKGLERGCVVHDGWIWIKNFLRHQKNDKLNPENNAHRSIITLINEQLTRFSFVPEFEEFVGANKGLLSPIGKGNGKGRGRGNKSYGAFFEKFWLVYPRKEGKGKAAEVWNRDGLDAETDRIIESVNQYVPIYAKRKPEFTPLPSTWLNEKRYDDTPGVKRGSRFEETI